MSARTFLTRAADMTQKSAVLGLLGMFGYYGFQIISNVAERKVDSPFMHSTYEQDVNEKVRQEYESDNVVDGRNERDWYATDDESRPRDQIRADLTTPEFKKQYQQEKK